MGSLKRSTVAIRSGYEDLLSESSWLPNHQQTPIDFRWGELLWCNFIDSEIPSWNPGRRQNLHPSSSRLWRDRWRWWHKTHLNIKMLLLPEGRACCDQATDTETMTTMTTTSTATTARCRRRPWRGHGLREGWTRMGLESLQKSLPQNDSWQQLWAICNLFDKFVKKISF